MKTEDSNSLIKQVESLIEGETDFFANAANVSAFIFDSLPDLNWVGFYMKTDGELLLGPFKGKAACIRIPWGKGVCGTAAEKADTIIVDDVHDFAGHIACDADSNSEIVVPINFNGKVIGVFDIDSPVKNRFSMYESELFNSIIEILLKNCNMERVLSYYGE